MGICMFMRKGSVHTKPGSRVPAGYTELEYIQSSGTQYIDTGVQLAATLSAEVDYQAVATTSDTWFFSVLSDSAGTGWRAGIYKNAFYLVDMTASQTVDLTARTLFTGHATESQALNIYLFAENRNGSAYGKHTGKMYGCRIWDNDVLVRDFVPCIDQDGNVGLYDVVTKAFYGNAGSGTFTAGLEVA